MLDSISPSAPLASTSPLPRLDIRHLVIGHCEFAPLEANGLVKVANELVREQIHAGENARLIYLCRTCEAAQVNTDIPASVLRLTGRSVGRHVVLVAPSILNSLTTSATERTVFHIHHCRAPVFVSVTRHLRRLNIPYAVTLHGRYSHIASGREPAKGALVTLYLKWFESGPLEAAKFVQVITPAECDIVKQLAPRAHCVLIPNVAYSSRATQQAHHRRERSQAFPTFGYCGRYAIEHKGLDLLIAGFAQYKRAGGSGILELSGPGEEGEALVNSAKALGVSAYVEVGPPVFGARKLARLAKWDFFVLPSRFDVLPTAALEAGLLGLPLITSAATGLHSEVGKFGAGINLEELTPEALADTFFVAEGLDSERWSQMSEAARAMVLALGDWAAVAKRMVTLYRA